MIENSWGFFSRRQKLKIHLYLLSFYDFLKFFDTKNDIFFKGQKSEKLLASQQRLAPPELRGGWYHMVPYGTSWYHMVPYGTLWYLMVPYGTLWYLMVPYGTLWYHKVP